MKQARIEPGSHCWALDEGAHHSVVTVLKHYYKLLSKDLPATFNILFFQINISAIYANFAESLGKHLSRKDEIIHIHSCFYFLYLSTELTEKKCTVTRYTQKLAITVKLREDF